MGLAWQQGPLAPGVIGRFLVPGPLPGRLLYAEPLRRPMRVRFGGAWIADSPAIGPLPGIYAPPPSSQPTAPDPLLCAEARAGSWVVRHMVDDPLLTGGTAYVREVMLTAGRAADSMIVSSRRRLLAHLRAGDGGGAALEMERHLRAPLYMWRLALPGSQAIAGEVVT